MRCFLLVCFLSVGCCFHPLNGMDTPSCWSVGFSERVGNGIGYRNGYTTLHLYHFAPQSECWAGWADARIHRFHCRDYAGGLTFGMQKSASSFFLAAASIDFLHRHHHTFSQFVLSAQWQTCLFGIHLNGSFAPSSGRAYDECLFLYDTGAEISFSRIDIPYSMVDCRLSSSELCFKGLRTQFFVGGYGLFSQRFESGKWGVLGQWFITFCEGTRIDAQASYDPIFHGRFSLGISLNWVFDERGCLSPCCTPCILPPVYRNEIIPIRSVCCWEANYNG